MTITHNEIDQVAPHVTGEAHEMEGSKNPYITLLSLEYLCQGNETLMFCLHELVLIALRYTETVCRFKQIVRAGQQSNEDGMRKEIESLRTAVHDSTIDSINVLSRNLKKAGKDISWMTGIVGNRAAYAKFAILIAFEVALREEVSDAK